MAVSLTPSDRVQVMVAVPLATPVTIQMTETEDTYSSNEQHPTPEPPGTVRWAV